MCGRFVRESPIEEIVKEFDIEQTSLDLEPSYNIAPQQNIAIIMEDDKKKIVKCRWGFIPSWAKDPSVSNKMINARAETVATKPSFRNGFMNRRCLIVANGFFEWTKRGKSKIPVYIRLKSLFKRI